MSVFSGKVPTRSVASVATVPELYNSKGQFLRYMTGEEVLSACGPVCDSAIAAQSGSFIASHFPPQNYFGNFGVTWLSGGVPPQPPTRYITTPKKGGKNGKAWAERHKTNAIIIHNYNRLSIEVKASMSITYQDNPGKTNIIKELWKTGLFPLDPLNSRRIIAPNGQYISKATVALECKSTDRAVVASSSLPQDKSVLDAVRSFQDGLEQDCNLIMGVYADSNAKTVDFLTSIAEMPETIKSILDAIKTCLRMYVDARKRAVRIYNKAKGNSKSATAKKNLIEAQDAITDVWLNYRYNIMPNVYLIEDLLKYSEKDLGVFLRDRGAVRSQEEFLQEIEGFSTVDRVHVTSRCMVKRFVGLSTILPKAQLHMSFNPAVTAWELFPLSFVYDWFLNIGTYLTCISGPPANVINEATSYSTKIDSTLTFTRGDKSFVVTIKAYKLRGINPTDAFRIQFNPDVGFYRQLDAIALGWKIFVRNLVK